MRAQHDRWTIGAAALAAGLLLAGAANAWYGVPWDRPLGSGAMTYERQTMMRQHGYAMRDLAAMIEGRRTFDRGEAIRLANELESGFGDALVRNYAPGAVVAGSRTVPWTWRDFGLFVGYSEAARQSADRLAEAMADEPDADEIGAQGAWNPRPAMGRRLGPRPAPYPARVGWRRPIDGLISMDAIHEYDRLNATCQSCHALFRGWRW
jgi:cytochrome c556